MGGLNLGLLENKFIIVTGAAQGIGFSAAESILNEKASKINIPDKKSLDELVLSLQSINEELWDIENHKRECEANKDFGERFIKLSRDVHFKNDIRASIKKNINLLSNSIIIEEKEYSKY